MSKTNVFTLIATALLGVLLYVIVELTRNLQTRSDIESTQQSDNPQPGSAYAELVEHLERKGIDSERAIAHARTWIHQRGFSGSHGLLNITGQDAAFTQYSDLDDAVLESLSTNGEMTATQILASRRISVDPFAAMELYATAARQGSTYAILQIASLRETLANTALDNYRAEPGYLEKLSDLRGDDPNPVLNIEAFAYGMAAVRDGGPPVIDADLMVWLQRMAEAIPSSQLESACELSEQIFLEIGAERRVHGIAPITRDPPAVFVSIPNLAEQLPCRETGHPFFLLLDLSNCEMYPSEMFGDSVVNLYICENW